MPSHVPHARTRQARTTTAAMLPTSTTNPTTTCHRHYYHNAYTACYITMVTPLTVVPLIAPASITLVTFVTTLSPTPGGEVENVETAAGAHNRPAPGLPPPLHRPTTVRGRPPGPRLPRVALGGEREEAGRGQEGLRPAPGHPS